MKRFVLVALLSIVFSIFLMGNFVNANCEDSQLILRLSGIDNAHVGMFNMSSYSTELCFEDFFESNYTGANPHAANAGGDNIVLELSDSDNAHVAQPFAGVYSNNLSYGDLKCDVVLRGSGRTCRSVVNNGHEGARIAWMSDLTNAHLARGGVTESGFNYQLCCASASIDPNVGGVCGDGVMDENSWETCDGDDFGLIHSCVDLIGPSGERFFAGMPGCSIGCYITTDTCVVEVTPPQEYCFQAPPPGEDLPKIYIEGNLTLPGSCGDYDNVIEADIPFGFDGTLLEYKEEICGTCYQFIPELIVPANGFNPYCQWNMGSELCELAFDTATQSGCTQHVISEGTCEPGQLYKTINYTSTCVDGNGRSCDPPNGCEVLVRCATVIEMPFFGWYSFVIAVFFIAGIYFATRRR